MLGDLVRLGLVAVAGALADAGPWPLVAASLPLLVREAALVAVLGFGWLRPLALLVPLDRLARRVPPLLVATLLLGTLRGDRACEDIVVLGSVAQVRAAAQASRASVEVVDGRARIRIEGPALIDLPAEAVQDERVAMVLCRLVRDGPGRALITHRAIAAAFGKVNRQDSTNRMVRFKAAGGSIATMIVDGPGGRPSLLHPQVRAAIVSHWERDPLASVEATCRWLAEQDLPPEAALPSPDELRAVRHLPGNLVVARNAARRLIERRGRSVSLALPALFRKLLEVVDAQHRRLCAAGVQPGPMPGVVRLAQDGARDATVRASETGLALMASMQALTAAPTPQQDEELAACVGTDHLAPLHWATLYCTLQISIGQVAALADRSKSVVYGGLVRLSRILEEIDPFPAATRFSGALALDEKWVKIPKSFCKADRDQGRRWRYVHFAVDAHTGDLLHIDVFEATDGPSVRTFLAAVRAKGIRPTVVVTDMLAAYGGAIRDTFGARVVHHHCLFHHLQAVRHRLRERCGADWGRHDLLRRLVELTDDVYRCRSRRTARSRLAKVLALRSELAVKHPEAVTLLDTISERFPSVANAIGRDDIPSTNNVTERTIKAFNRHYKRMAGFESMDTARIQVRLFRFCHRLTPMREARRREHRGLCPLERAGWQTRGVPVADYVRRLVMASDEDRLGLPAPPQERDVGDDNGRRPGETRAGGPSSPRCALVPGSVRPRPPTGAPDRRLEPLQGPISHRSRPLSLPRPRPPATPVQQNALRGPRG